MIFSLFLVKSHKNVAKLVLPCLQLLVTFFGREGCGSCHWVGIGGLLELAKHERLAVDMVSCISKQHWKHEFLEYKNYAIDGIIYVYIYIYIYDGIYLLIHYIQYNTISKPHGCEMPEHLHQPFTNFFFQAPCRCKRKFSPWGSI